MKIPLILTRPYLVLISCTFLMISCSTSKSINKIFETEETFVKGFSGLAVYDLEKNKMIYERNSRKYFIPASTTKLFTFYTGLKILGDSVPGLKFLVRGDSLIFTGTGDPSFLYPDLPASGVFNFLKNKKEQLYYLSPSFEEEIYGPGWAWDDYNYSFSVERTIFPIYGNRVSFTFSEGATIPDVVPKIFRDSVLIAQPPLHTSGIKRVLNRNKFIYSGGAASRKLEQFVPFKSSSELLVQMLSDTLQKKVELLKNAPEGFTEATVLYSIPVDSLYMRMLQESDNFIAEQILLLAAGKLSNTLKSDMTIKHMKENYLNSLPDEPRWVDGSGLSRYNLFTPRTMVALLSLIHKEIPQERLFDLLAVGGVSGTIKNDYKGSPPYIFAKTGTLSNNHSLSGYLVARSGKTFAFSFMNSNYIVATSEIKAQMERILRNIYEEN